MCLASAATTVVVISMRHPERADRFFMSRSRSPELVVLDDIMEFDLDCNPIDQRGRSMYGERPISLARSISVGLT